MEDVFIQISKTIETLPPWVGGALMSIIVAVLRVVYDKEETSAVRILLEGLLCGALTLTAGSAVAAMGMPHEWYLFCGGVIGFIGSQSIRNLAMKILNKKVHDIS